MKVECICLNCGKSFLKAKNEYNRRIRLNKANFYCSSKCHAQKFGTVSFGDNINKIPIRQQSNFKPVKQDPFRYYLKVCKLRKDKFEVSIDIPYLKEIWNNQKGLCNYTGIVLVLSTHTSGKSDKRFAASIDRIDSSKGYIKGNIQFVSSCINLMKNDLTHEQTIEFINIIKNK